MVQATQEAEKLVRDYLAVWNKREYSKIPDIVSESFRMHDPAAPAEGVPGPEREVHGPEGLEAFIREVVTAFPEFQVTIIDMLAGDDLVMCEAEMTMTQEGEFGGIPPTGKKVENREMSVFRIMDGKVHEHRVYFDMQEALEQLGVTAG